MKKFISLVFVSVIGGAVTLASYKTFFEKSPEDQNLMVTGLSPQIVQTKYVSGNAAGLPADAVEFTDAAEKTIHTVVHVKNTAVNNSPGNPILEFLYGYGGGQGREVIGSGSGVIISPDGYIITNNHVIDNATKISITLNDNREFEAKLIGTDPKSDIALIKIDAGKNLPFITFGDSDNTKIGEWVLAVGNPYNLNSTVTAGIISAKARDLGNNPAQSIQSFIQTDAAVNPGNSGGALVNTRGELIGINTAITSQTGSYVGYSFAVPSNIARKVVEDLMEFGGVQRGILGVTGGEVNNELVKKLGLNETEGFYVSEVEPNSGASKAGLKKGDVIIKLDNIKISKFADLSGYLNTKRPGDEVNVSIDRSGELKDFKVKLTKNEFVIYNLYGIELKNMSTEEAKKRGLKQGVAVSQVRRADLIKYGGVEEGYVITAINGVKVYTVEDVAKIIEAKSDEQPILLDMLNKSGGVEKIRFFGK